MAEQTEREFWTQWQQDNREVNKARHARQAEALRQLVADGTVKMD